MYSTYWEYVPTRSEVAGMKLYRRCTKTTWSGGHVATRPSIRHKYSEGLITRCHSSGTHFSVYRRHMTSEAPKIPYLMQFNECRWFAIWNRREFSVRNSGGHVRQVTLLPIGNNFHPNTRRDMLAFILLAWIKSWNGFHCKLTRFSLRNNAWTWRSISQSICIFRCEYLLTWCCMRYFIESFQWWIH